MNNDTIIWKMDLDTAEFYADLLYDWNYGIAPYKQRDVGVADDVNWLYEEIDRIKKNKEDRSRSQHPSMYVAVTTNNVVPFPHE